MATQSHSTKFFSRQVLLQSFAKAVWRTVVEWAPRECHKEADLLANGIVEIFNPALETKVDTKKLVWNIFPQGF